MKKIAYAIKIEQSLVERIRNFCLSHGVKQGFFVEKALKEQLKREELIEDMLDLKQLRYQEGASVSFEEYLKKRKS